MKKNMKKTLGLLTGAAMFASQTAAVAEANVTVEAREEETFDKVANVQGVFSFAQDVVTPTDEVFNLFGTAATAICAKPGFAMEKMDTEHHYVNLSGKIHKSATYSLENLKEMASQTKDIVCSCGSGHATAQMTVTGIPVSLLVEMAGVDAGVNTITMKSADGYGIPMPLQYVLDQDAMLVYKINGEDYPAEAGGLQVFMPATIAKYFTRQVTEIELTASEQAPEVQEMPEALRAKVSVINRMENDSFAVGDRVVFEGYADDCGKAIAALEYSMDGGETWTRCETKGASADRWVYWYFGYDCVSAGNYKLDVRAVTEDGMVSPLAASIVFAVK